jgi:hypothetical protein
MKSQFYSSLLIILLAFLSIGAIYGGTTLIINPNGAVFNIPVDLLQKSPFHDSRNYSAANFRIISSLCDLFTHKKTEQLFFA